MDIEVTMDMNRFSCLCSVMNLLFTFESRT